MGTEVNWNVYDLFKTEAPVDVNHSSCRSVDSRLGREKKEKYSYILNMDYCLNFFHQVTTLLPPFTDRGNRTTLEVRNSDW